MRWKILIAVWGGVVLLTLINHVRWTPVLLYPLYPGAMAHLAVAGGHGGTLTQEKLGFFAELGTNLLVYTVATLLLLRFIRFSGR